MDQVLRLKSVLGSFLRPILILVGILLALYLLWIGQTLIANVLFILLIVLGSYDLFIEIFSSLIKGQFALDYIAIGAIVVAIITNQFMVGAVIALMLATGKNLEDYAGQQAKRNLTALIDRIPNDVYVVNEAGHSVKTKIDKVKVGEKILVRKGEVIPLDGVLVSENALTDESSLTGEPYFFEKFAGDSMRSGTLNIGESVTILVQKAEADSIYRKIIEMVKEAQDEKAPLVRLADKYSTILTLIISVGAYLFTHSLDRVLAVLVVATPCPLILATPIALMGGVSACAKKRIIVKKLAALESLSRINAIIFDKTGTLTMGKPQVSELKVFDHKITHKDLYATAASIERNSLHPLAKAIVEAAKEHDAHMLKAQNVKEIIGKGIEGEVNGHVYQLVRSKDDQGMAIDFFKMHGTEAHKIATFMLEDSIKSDTIVTLKKMQEFGLETYMFTGDKKTAAEKVVEKLGIDLHIRAECTPEDKQTGVKELKAAGKVTAMVGDGINDAPALALADIGMVFSNEEQTASTEAADLVFLGGDFTLVLHAINTSKRTIAIALQSIKWGIGMSILAMLCAAFGLILPLIGAVIQELIDVSVILNALRAAKSPR